MGINVKLYYTDTRKKTITGLNSGWESDQAEKEFMWKKIQGF